MLISPQGLVALCLLLMVLALAVALRRTRLKMWIAERYTRFRASWARMAERMRTPKSVELVDA